jgi:lipoyl(octanoyl) transferase
MKATTRTAVTLAVLDTAPAPGAWNMAVDAALMDAVREGTPPVLRFYRWEPACLSLGRNQPARGHYDADALRAEGVDVVRRPTGGRAVLHDRELTYSFVAPARRFGSPRALYQRGNQALVRGLRALGAEVAVAAESGRRAPAPSVAPCFAEPVAGEVVAGRRKLVGSAQVVERGVLLQHGSLPLDGDSTRITRLTADGEPPSAARLADLLPALPPWETLVNALARAWADELNLAMESLDEAPSGLPGFTMHHARFCDPAWSWHR